MSVKHSTPAVLVFHKLQASFSFGVTNFSPARFGRLIQSLNDARREYVVTFDDGYRHLAAVLPQMIERLGIRPVVFMPTAWIGKKNSWDYSHWFAGCPHLERREIRELANAGVQFESHGHSHRPLTALSEKSLKMELRQSREILSELTGREVGAISYPFGRQDERVQESVEWAGYRAGYTMRFPADGDGAFAQGRIPIYGYDTSLSVRMKLGEGTLHRVEGVKTQITNQLSGGTILLNRLRRLD